MQDEAPSEVTGESGQNYSLEAEIGRGGMGLVFAGRDPSGDVVAIKILRDTKLDDRFSREVATVKRLTHPGVVQLIDHGRDEQDTPFLVMEFLRGTPLDAELVTKAAKRLPWTEVVSLLEHLLGILEAVHAQGVVHRDIKPSNVFLTDTGAVKLLDFGIARIRSETQQPMTKTGDLFGTAEYMSPEQCKGLPSIDHRSDLYSVGILAYELLTGAPPFKADLPLAVLNKHLNEDPPPFDAVLGIPKALATVVFDALAKSPEDRPATAAAMLDTVATIPHPEPSAPTLALSQPPVRVSQTEHLRPVPTEPAFVATPTKPSPKKPPAKRLRIEDISPADERAHDAEMGTRFHIEQQGGRGPLTYVAVVVGLIAAVVIAYVLIDPDGGGRDGGRIAKAGLMPLVLVPNLDDIDPVDTALETLDLGGGSDPMLVAEVPKQDEPVDDPDPSTPVAPVTEPAQETTAADEATCTNNLNCFNKGRAAAEVYDWGLAFLYFRRGCARGNGNACAQMARILREHRDQIPPGHAKGTSVIGALESGCALQKPHASSCFSAGFAYLHGLHHVAVDRDKALWRLERSCDARDSRGCEVLRCEREPGDADACFAFGSRYQRSEGKDPNAEEYLTRACALEHGEACRSFARYIHAHRKNYSPEETPSRHVVKFYEKGCEYDDLPSCTALVEIYGSGYGAVVADADKAAEFRERTCELGAEGCPKTDVGAQAADTDHELEPDVGTAPAPP